MKLVQIFYLIRVMHIVQISAVYSKGVMYECVKVCVFLVTIYKMSYRYSLAYSRSPTKQQMYFIWHVC